MVPYLYLQLPREVIDENLNVVEMLPDPYVEGGDPYVNHRAVSNTPMTANGLVNADLSATMEHLQLSWVADKPTSPFHDVLHRDQSKLACVYVVPNDSTLREICSTFWPNNPELAEIAVGMNDPSRDMSNNVQTPVLELRSSDGGGSGAGGARPNMRRASGANTKRGAQVPQFDFFFPH